MRALDDITDPSTATLVLESLGMSTEAPEPARARDPTELFDGHSA
ncbi:MAG TPA: hypothetical protein VMI75_12400 [Polyangiaceae bacterium]|nr:hypothetical protein [Polyangiaceae bacterium]